MALRFSTTARPKPKRACRSTTGITAPRRFITPCRKSGVRGRTVRRPCSDLTHHINGHQQLGLPTGEPQHLAQAGAGVRFDEVCDAHATPQKRLNFDSSTLLP